MVFGSGEGLAGGGEERVAMCGWCQGNGGEKG